jgi:hypothetical protein
MKSRIRTPKKKTSLETPDFSTAPDREMFPSRPFVVQSQTAEKSQQPDLKTSLLQAERYGHHLSRMHPAGVAATAVQPKLGKGQQVESDRAKAPQVLQAKLTGAVVPIQKASDKKEKKAQQGGKTVDYGSSISNTVSDTAKSINTAAAGGVGGVLKLPMAGLDLYDAYKAGKAGDKSNAAASGAKGITGALEGSANIAKFGGEAVSALGVGIAGGTGGTLTGLVDAVKGGTNIKKAKGAYKTIKGTARDVANQVEPSPTPDSKRNTEELRNVLENIPNQIEKKKIIILTKSVEIFKKQNEIDNNETEIDQSPEANKQTLTTKKTQLEEEKKALEQEKAALEQEKATLEKKKDMLAVALQAAEQQKKTKKRETVNTVAGTGQIVGGSLAIAGSAGAGFGAIPGAAVSMGAASVKPGAWALRKLKQLGRDRHVIGFDVSKSTEIKDNERGAIAKMMADGRQEKEMQTIFENLPNVSKDEIKRFNSTDPNEQMQQEEIKMILKRRHY